MTEEEQKYKDEYVNSKWFKSRSKAIQEKALEYPPYWNYVQKSTGYVCRIYSLTENKDGSCDHCQVAILVKENEDNERLTDKVFKYPLTQDRVVFGIPFDDLEKLNLLKDQR